MPTKTKRSFAAANKARANKNPPLVVAELSDSPVRLMSKAEVLERTGIAFVSIWRWMREGTFPAARSVGGKSVWIEAEVEAWIKSLPVRDYKKLEPA